MKVVDTGFESLANKINQAINRVGDDGYLKFRQSFIRANLTIDQIKEIGNDFANNPAFGADVIGKLNHLKNGVLRFTIEQNEQQATARNVLTEMRELKDRILNPHSHGTAMPLYRQELKDAIQTIEDLKIFLDAQ